MDSPYLVTPSEHHAAAFNAHDGRLNAQNESLARDAYAEVMLNDVLERSST